MCTITLSYNENDQVANEKLAALLSTGLFVKVPPQEELDIDYSDASLYEMDANMPIVSKDMSPEELEKLILEDIHSIYAAGNAL
mgnify:FL=1